MSNLRDKGASLDIGCKKFAAPETLTGEHALVEHIPDNNNMTCLRPSELEIECEPRHVVSKVVVSPKHLGWEKYILENQTNELLESNLEQNGLSKLEIENATQVSNPRRKEVEEKSISLTIEVAKIELEENLVDVEIRVPSFTKDDKEIMNLIKINVDEVTEALLKSEESAPLIQKIEKGMNNEGSDQEEAPIQLMAEQMFRTTIKLVKSKFVQDCVTYLGLVVKLERRSFAQLKVKTIKICSITRNKTQVKGLGVAGCDRQYISIFSCLVAPSTESLKRKSKKGDIKWISECRGSFRQWKKELFTNPVLCAPDFTKRFIFQPDLIFQHLISVT
ncbi:retrovirus-related Pol polyprotein from transposon 17.6 [Trichonephila clavata]|uniref:Retrovirus-related Pol polyprotein from transposon 17.6 n=1 Tax=Trichonephila clavata TaxID=2740835 RepID=A0A8X6G666_TRICU|nr:retrovirus-related Pol polyprotein from transposon 17.6 [Trichonephila clavata]